MPPIPIQQSAANLDLSPRMSVSTVVVASPAAAAETVIASIGPLFGGLSMMLGVLLWGWAAYTVGTSGTAVRLRLRKGTDTTGTVVGDSGALTGSQHGAGILSADDIQGTDTAPAAGGQSYVLTMTVTAGSAPSTVSQTFLFALGI